MGKKRFFDDRLKYLSFIQNTSEKKSISERIYPHVASMPENKTYLRILDAGTGDGTIKSNVIKSFHRYHPYTSLLITGKEVSYEDLKNTLEKMPDRFVEHPNLLVTMTNVKFSELGSIESSNKIGDKKVKKFNLVLKSDNSFDFNQQISGSLLGNFIKKNWGIEIDNKSRTSYSNPCIIRVYREDNEKHLKQFIKNDYKNNDYDLIIASQHYRSRVTAEKKVKYVIEPMIKSLSKKGKLVVVHACGGDPANKIVKKIWPKENPFPYLYSSIEKYIKSNTDKSFLKTLKFHKVKKISYVLRALPNEISGGIATSLIFSAWNAAVYVNQISDEQIMKAEKHKNYQKVVQNIVNKYKGLHFKNELFVIEKK